jgi:plastocyanin
MQWHNSCATNDGTNDGGRSKTNYLKEDMMKTPSRNLKGAGRWLAMAMLLMFAMVEPATHTILFGGTVGLAYSPNSLTATVGDTIRWQGDFTMHPLSSTTIPSGATVWHVTTGTEFNYPVKTPGTYNYQCDVHFSVGMTGSFTANAMPVIEKTGNRYGSGLQIQEIEPNPALRSQVRIAYIVPEAQKVTLALYSLQGRKVATLVQGRKEAGKYQVDMLPDELASGTYFCRLQGIGSSSQRSLFIIR